MEIVDNQDNLISKFKENLNKGDCKYCSKIVDGHIIIDVPKDENHFWSPQLNIEIEQNENNKSIVKGLFGPKPNCLDLIYVFSFCGCRCFYWVFSNGVCAMDFKNRLFYGINCCYYFTCYLDFNVFFR